MSIQRHAARVRTTETCALIVEAHHQQEGLMHARMTVAYTQPDRFDEALASVQEAFLPAAQAQPGYQGFLLLTDRETQQLVGISLWEAEADMHSSGGSGGYY